MFLLIIAKPLLTVVVLLGKSIRFPYGPWKTCGGVCVR